MTKHKNGSRPIPIVPEIELPEIIMGFRVEPHEYPKKSTMFILWIFYTEQAIRLRREKNMGTRK